MSRKLLALLLLPLLLGGCTVPIAIGLGAAAASVAVGNDRRTAGMIIDDESIEINTMDIVARDPLLRDSAHINATSYNG